MTARRRGYWILLLAILALATQASVLGQTDLPPLATPSADGRVFGVAPAGEPDLSPFRLEIAAGDSLATALVVTNESTESLELRTHAADIATAVNGGYTVLPEGSSAPEEAAWLSVPAAPYTIEPGQELMLSIAVSVPEGTPPGEYMAAIATATTESAAMEGTNAFRLISKKVNAVVITVPGEISAGFEIGTPTIDLADGSTIVTLPIQNTGNTRVKPTGAITIATTSGETLAEIPVAMGSVYAWDSTTIQSALSPALPAGDYLVTVELLDNATGAAASLPATVVTAKGAT